MDKIISGQRGVPYMYVWKRSWCALALAPRPKCLLVLAPNNKYTTRFRINYWSCSRLGPVSSIFHGRDLVVCTRRNPIRQKYSSSPYSHNDEWCGDAYKSNPRLYPIGLFHWTAYHCHISLRLSSTLARYNEIPGYRSREPLRFFSIS